MFRKALIQYAFEADTKNYRRFDPVEATVPSGVIAGPMYLPKDDTIMDVSVVLTYTDGKETPNAG